MSDNLNTLSGKVIKILPVVSGDSKHRPGEKWFRQEFVIETYAQYPRTVCFQMWGEDRIKAANLQLNEDVTITYELSSREFQERWYTSADVRNIMKGMPNQQAQGMGGYGMPPQQGYGMPPQQGYGMPPQQGYGMPQQPLTGEPQMPNTNAPFGPQQGGGDDLPF